jgi:hypothetical protein
MMWLTSGREHVAQGIDDPGFSSTAWSSDVLKMLTSGVRVGSVLVQEAAHQLKSHTLQIVERIAGGGKMPHLHKAFGEAYVEKYSRTLYDWIVFILPRNGNLGVTMPNKQIVDVGVTRGGCATLETALHLIEHSEMQHVLGLCRGPSILPGKSRMLA